MCLIQTRNILNTRCDEIRAPLKENAASSPGGRARMGLIRLFSRENRFRFLPRTGPSGHGRRLRRHRAHRERSLRRAGARAGRGAPGGSHTACRRHVLQRVWLASDASVASGLDGGAERPLRRADRQGRQSSRSQSSPLPLGPQPRMMICGSWHGAAGARRARSLVGRAWRAQSRRALRRLPGAAARAALSTRGAPVAPSDSTRL